MSQTTLFKKLGAPLATSRRSWGSVRAADNTVFLRVWQDQMCNRDGKYFIQISYNKLFQAEPNDAGHQERLKHIELIRNGAACYMIMCRAADPKELPRTVKTLNEREVFPGGDLIEIEGDVWIEQRKRVPLEDALVPQKA